jgi:hypothetical protein
MAAVILVVVIQVAVEAGHFKVPVAHLVALV